MGALCISGGGGVSWDPFTTGLRLSSLKPRHLRVFFFGKDQKGIYKRGIHDQGDFWKFLLETAV